MECALKPEEIAGILGIPLKTFYKLAVKGQLPVFKVGKQWRAKPSALEKFMAGEWQSTPKRRPGRQIRQYAQEFTIPATDSRFR